MNYRILHRTIYDYTEPVTVSHHAARLKPRFTDVQKCADFSLAIIPDPAVRTARPDYFGNQVSFFGIQQIHQRLEITAVSHVSVRRVTPPALALSPPWEHVATLFRDPVSPEAGEPYPFCFDSPPLRAPPGLAHYAPETCGLQRP